MRLRKIKIQNFRKLNDVEINLGDATFLIGANNAGKSSTLDVIEYLVTDKKLDYSCRSKYIVDGEELTKTEDVIIEGCFDNVDATIVNQRGFNSSRLNSYPDENGNVKYFFNYRVRLTADGKNHREIQMHQQKLKDEFVDCKKWQDFIDKGVVLASSIIIRSISDKSLGTKVTSTSGTLYIGFITGFPSNPILGLSILSYIVECIVLALYNPLVLNTIAA